MTTPAKPKSELWKIIFSSLTHMNEILIQVLKCHVGSSKYELSYRLNSIVGKSSNMLSFLHLPRKYSPRPVFGITSVMSAKQNYVGWSLFIKDSRKECLHLIQNAAVGIPGLLIVIIHIDVWVASVLLLHPWKPEG